MTTTMLETLQEQASIINLLNTVEARLTSPILGYDRELVKGCLAPIYALLDQDAPSQNA